jgi:putative FmdB family regulatory protein
MAIYEFECWNCGKTEEMFLHHSESESDIKCNRCGEKMARIPSAFAKTAKQWEVK